MGELGSAPPARRLSAAALSMTVAVVLAIATVVAITAGTLVGPQTAIPSFPADLLSTQGVGAGPISDPGTPLDGPPAGAPSP